MSQKSLANAVGVSFQQIQHYEAGANGITAVRLFEIAKVLNVSVSVLFPVPGAPAHHKP
jgi:transcriptional regulator with XRE-family HTH domain